jgi:hypothetical protein
MGKMNKFDHPLSVERIKEILEYDTETGSFVWKQRGPELFIRPKSSRAWNRRYAGKKAFACHDKDGYCVARIYGKQYKAHRVAWAYHYGQWPSKLIDHDNRDPSDNRIENLKASSYCGNSRNKKLPNDNTSGTVGVCWSISVNRWIARIGVNGTHKWVGCFIEKDAAIAARLDAEIRFGYHRNHGKEVPLKEVVK